TGDLHTEAVGVRCHVNPPECQLKPSLRNQSVTGLRERQNGEKRRFSTFSDCGMVKSEGIGGKKE
ncbi:MAG: hypothetical protein J1E33_07580, partial [Alistipes sp.]|nr:hypothetical protein [Alistipes sp.]